MTTRFQDETNIGAGLSVSRLKDGRYLLQHRGVFMALSAEAWAALTKLEIPEHE